MATTKKPATPAADAPADKLATVLGLANTTATTELGAATNKSVTAAATLTVSATEAGNTVNDGANASVTVGRSHSESKAS